MKGSDVHLTGYLEPSDDEESDLEDEEGSEEEGSEEESENVAELLKKQ